jgi:hypothetical protein
MMALRQRTRPGNYFKRDGKLPYRRKRKEARICPESEEPDQNEFTTKGSEAGYG